MLVQPALRRALHIARRQASTARAQPCKKSALCVSQRPPAKQRATAAQVFEFTSKTLAHKLDTLLDTVGMPPEAIAASPCFLTYSATGRVLRRHAALTKRLRALERRAEATGGRRPPELHEVSFTYISQTEGGFERCAA